jgi:DNA repair protein RadC
MKELFPQFEGKPSPYRHQPAPALRLMESGPAALSDLELAATLTGSAETAAKLFDHYGNLGAIIAAPTAELEGIKGIGTAVIARLSATREIWKRVSHYRQTETSITTPEDVYALLAPEMQGLAQEEVRVILLNHRKRLIRVETVFTGTGNECFANPSEILRRAIVRGANAIILVHNHPTGDPTPSMADHEVTRRLKAAAVAVGIELTDHIVIGRPAEGRYETYFSFREAGLI